MHQTTVHVEEKESKFENSPVYWWLDILKQFCQSSQHSFRQNNICHFCNDPVAKSGVRWNRYRLGSMFCSDCSLYKKYINDPQYPANSAQADNMVATLQELRSVRALIGISELLYLADCGIVFGCLQLSPREWSPLLDHHCIPCW